MDEDDRFSHIKNDPRFRSVPKHEKKIHIDKRFTSMFHNKGFQLNYFMDKRGRPVQQSMSEDLRKYYEVDSEPSDNENQSSPKIKGVSKKVKRKLNKYEEKKEDIDSGRDSSVDERGDVDHSQGKPFLMKKEKKIKKKQTVKVHIQKTRSSDDEDQEKGDDNKMGIKRDEDNDEEQEEVTDKDDDSDVSGEASEPDLARGEGNVTSSSSEESSDDYEDEEEESGFDHQWGETAKTVTRSEDISHRLALCNMDWDRIKAEDLYVLFNNFKPSQGIIHSVKIYPSEYGIQRMKEEELHGPKELTSTVLEREEAKETHDGSKYHMETLRQYQLNRLRYYYAVVECDSVETASTLYNELDGKEYESSASQLDLRYIPDDMVFDQDPKSVSDKLPDMSVYTPVLFTTKALQQTMVELTWDETNPNRMRTLEKAFNNEDDNLNSDLRAYLASSSSSSSEDETHDKDKDDDLLEPVKERHQATDRISKYKELLASIEEDENKKKHKDIEMEITWEPGLKDRTENLIKMKQQEQEMGYFEKYLENKKQRKKEAKKATELSKANGSDDLCDDDDVPSDIDLNDSFFQDEINSTKVKKSLKKSKIRSTSQTEGQDVKSKAELELLLMDEEEDGKKHFNLKNLMEDETLSKSKRKKLEKTRIKEQKLKTEDGFKINAEDPRFSALFQSADYNIDPSDTHFKKTKAMEALLQEKQKRRAGKRLQDSNKVNSEESSKRMDPSLSYLVKSVKNKTENFKRRKN